MSWTVILFFPDAIPWAEGGRRERRKRKRTQRTAPEEKKGKKGERTGKNVFLQPCPKSSM